MILIKDRHLHFLQHKRCVLQLGTMILIKNRHRNFFSLFFFCFFLGTMILIKDRHLNPKFKNISCAVGNMILIKDRHLNPLNLVLQIEHDTYKGSTQWNRPFLSKNRTMGNMILIKSEFWRLGLQFFIIVFT